MASGGFRRKCAGSTAATASGHESSKAILSQTADKARLRATGDCYRQTQELRSGEETGDEEGGASSAQGIEQSSGELPSTDSNARATDATIQIHWTSATISLSLGTDSRPLSPDITKNSANDLKIGEKSLG